MYNIPLYSKNPDFTGLPEFYDEAKGCKIKIDNKWYYDFSTNGIGCNMLGYANKYVNYNTKKCIDKGNFSSLNSKYMEKVTNLLLELHPDMDVIRFGNSAGEMLYLALKLTVENCNVERGFWKPVLQIGYNGWIIKNEIEEYDKNIQYEHLNELNDIISIHYRPKIVIFELPRHDYMEEEVMYKLNEWQKQGTILIIDEVTTGFRFRCSGLYQSYNLKPDIVVYAKAISNGYSFACILGKKEIMESDLWVSSTYWTDAIGFVATYHTINKLKKCNYKLIKDYGFKVMEIWKNYSEKYNIKIKIGEIPNIANFEFDYENKLELKSLFIQEMLKHNILASDQFYPTFAHSQKSIDIYSKACDKVFEKIKDYLIRIYKPEIKLLKVLNK
jgi:glutamate-1-semialdehyde 2,1-aminomutase